MSQLQEWVRRPRNESLLSVASGVLLVGAFAPFGLWPLAVVALAGAFWLWSGHGPRRAFWLGWLFGLGSFGAGTYWLYVSLHVFGNVPLPLAIGLMVALICFLSLYPALVAAIAGRLAPEAGWRRELLLLPALWAFAEWFRGWFLTGFPWLSVGYSQVDSPLAGLAPVIGIYGLGFVLALSAGLLLQFLALHHRRRLPPAAAFLALWLAAAGLAQVEWTEADGEPQRAALLQGSIPQDRKWDPEERQPTIDLYREMTEAHWDLADVIIWPEAALPVLYHQVRFQVLDPLAEEAAAHDTELFMGMLTREVEGHFYNTILKLDADEHHFYRKNQLVPFGEFFPVPDFIRNWMRMMSLPYSDFERGGKDQTPLQLGGRPIAASICYEDVFPREIRRPLPEASLLVNVSNDAWFGDTIAPHQHLEIARMRSLEMGREMLRSTNTGVSAIIGHRGEVRERLPQFETDALVGEFQHRRGATPFAVIGNWVNVPVFLVLIGVGGWFRRR
ncbi:apolipoprotein N-acyltransferase [Natronospira proteinivora]|uniref:Apolipoprotein N-acyltransferase n=1 Tax=Natronospira proteinivora TaxID=1807133 RepID=A0ABT1GB89_9GAMM|nr:apolipoprotein N-acyltransferase [Natronospira proteinivora]MCP1728559.1 apolipoprotein N-acyltransferase [Natronospira proteinivora]